MALQKVVSSAYADAVWIIAIAVALLALNVFRLLPITLFIRTILTWRWGASRASKRRLGAAGSFRTSIVSHSPPYVSSD